MIDEAEKDRQASRRASTIVEATAGNTGLGLARGIPKGYLIVW